MEVMFDPQRSIDYINRCIKEQGLSQRAIGDLLGYDQGTISRKLRDPNLSCYDMLNFAKVIGKHFFEVFFGQDLSEKQIETLCDMYRSKYSKDLPDYSMGFATPLTKVVFVGGFGNKDTDISEEEIYRRFFEEHFRPE